MKAIIIFCEGPHDVAFIQNVFKLKFGLIANEKVKISDIKKPFGPFLNNGLKKHFMGDLSLEMSHKFFLPNLVYETSSNYILVFNSGGEKNISDIKYLISNFEYNYNLIPREQTEVDTIDYIFTFDCDYKAPSEKVESCKTKLNKVTKQDLRNEDYNDDSTVIWSFTGINSYNEMNYAYIGDRVGFYFWTNSGEPGTLENIYFPIMSECNESLLQNAQNFVDSNFSTKMQPSNPQKEKEVIAKKAKRLKAIMACAGQGEDTGAALSTIYKLNHLITDDVFSNNPDVTSFANFINYFFPLSRHQ